MKPINLDIENKIATGFIVPDNYFDDFSGRLLAKIPAKKVKIVSIFSQRKNWIYAAAIFIIGLSIPVINHFYNNSTDIEKVDLENYIANHSTINDIDIADLLTDKDIQEMNNNMNIEDKAIEKELTGNENLEEYLIN